MKTIRCFLAVNVDLAVARRLADAQRSLRTACAEAGLPVNWVPPQNMHVTLRFLGAITEPMVQAIMDTSSSLARQTAPVDFGAGGFGVFPDDGNPHVLYAGISDSSGALGALYDSLSSVLDRIGFKPESRAFTPHVTLGRIVSPEEGALNRILTGHSLPDCGVSTVRDVLCYRSDLQTKKTDYHLLWRLPLLGKKKLDAPQIIAPSGAQGVASDEEQS